MNRSLVFDLAAGTFKDSKSPAFWNARNNDPPLCPPGKVLISDGFSGNWQLAAGNCFLQALSKQENRTVRLCRRPARSFSGASTKKQFGRKNYYTHALLAQSMGNPASWSGLNRWPSSRMADGWYGLIFFTGSIHRFRVAF